MSHKILPPARKQNKQIDPLAGIIARLEAMGQPGEAKELKPKSAAGPLADGRQGMADMLFSVDPTLGLALARAAKEAKEKNYKRYEGK